MDGLKSTNIMRYSVTNLTVFLMLFDVVSISSSSKENFL